MMSSTVILGILSYKSRLRGGFVEKDQQKRTLVLSELVLYLDIGSADAVFKLLTLCQSPSHVIAKDKV